MKSFLKMLAASIAGNLLAYSLLMVVSFALLMGLFIGGVGALGQLMTAEAAVKRVPRDSVLVVDLWMNISDTPPIATAGQLLTGEPTPTVYLLEMVDAIEQAAYDKRIKALFIHGSLMPENGGAGYAALTEVKRALETFQRQNKPVIVYLVEPTIREYYMVSAADLIFINPYGTVALNGLGGQMMYLAGAFDKYGIGVQTTRVGKYKSAVETFTRTEMSDADREQLGELFETMWLEIMLDVSRNRGISLEQLRRLVNEQGIFTARQAVELNLADRLAYMDEVIAELASRSSEADDHYTFSQIGLVDYIEREGTLGPDNYGYGNQIAVVYAEGQIVDGWGMPADVGGDRLARLLRDVRHDDDVQGVVLRVNSPGGSVMASEKIQREMRLLQSEKPTVVSMGSLAASGGYWIASYSDRIFAEPMTL